MKKFLLFLALASVGALASVTAAQAGNTTSTTFYTVINYSVFVPCANGGAGENVDFNATRRDIFRTTINDNNFSQSIESSFLGPDNPIGIGETTGDTYKEVGDGHETDTGSFTNGQATVALSIHLNIFGGGAHFREGLLVHETLNANGDMTVSFDTLNAVCG